MNYPIRKVVINMGYGAGVFGNNGFILLVVLFILLIIVGNSYPTGGDLGAV
jgi:uncharacterized protein (TIGR01732 family)